MKKCIKCGKEIINGINGCQMMKECFDCHGGCPDYSRNKSNFRWNTGSGADLDVAEDRCLGDV